MDIIILEKLIIFILQEWKLITFLASIFILYFYYTSTFNYFKKKGIPFKKPVIFLGTLGSSIRPKKSFHEVMLETYNDFKGHKMAGTFLGRKPVLYILDPDLIKAITIRDFEHFVDRNRLRMTGPRYLKRSLLNLQGTEWKELRKTLTPAFSSARLKNMLPLLQLCASEMVVYLKQYNNKDVEMKTAMGHFTLEVIGACAFGVRCDALGHENAHFVKVAEKALYLSKAKSFLILLTLLFIPKMFKFLKLTFLNLEATRELLKLLKISKMERRSSGVRKNDFLQLLIDAADKEKSESENNTIKNLDDDTIDAQSLLFLLAGFETSSTLLSFAIHVLATKPELQNKLRAHIEEMTNGKEMDYELLSKLTYVEAFLTETLRIYPPIPGADRVCTKKYKIPGTSVYLDIGDVVVLPSYGVHMDPEFYPEPQEFRPERFMNEEKNERVSHLFMAFGLGPRNCIGSRFAMFSAKMAMVALLRNFKFSVCNKTEDPIMFHKSTVMLKSANGVWVHLENIQ